MIVICTGCQARFRVADEKIGPRGAKVRCTRCQSVFVVKREAAGAPPPGPSIDLDLTPGLPRPALAADPFAPAGASVIPFPAPPPAAAEAAGVDPFAAAGLETFAPGVGADDPFVRATAGLAVDAAAPVQGAAPAADPFAAAADPFGAEAPEAGTTGARHLPVTDLAQLLGGGAPGATAPAPRPPPPRAPPPAPPPPAIAPFPDDLALEEHSGALAGPVPAAPAPFADPADVMPADRGFLASSSSGSMFDPGPSRGEDFLALATDKTPGPPVLSPPPVPAASDEDSDVEAWAAQFPGGAGPAATPPPAPGPAPAAAPEPEERSPPPPTLPARAAPAEAPTHRVRNAALSALALVALLVLALAIRVVLRGDVPLGPAALRPSTLLRSLGQASAAGPFELRDVRSGVYPQASGGAVVFVRGVVVWRAPAPVPGVRVEAELVRDGQVLSRGEVVAGAVPSPEEVYRAVDRGGREALAAALRERAPQRVAPGDPLGFLVTLGDPPGDLSGTTVRLQARPEGGAAH